MVDVDSLVRYLIDDLHTDQAHPHLPLPLLLILIYSCSYSLSFNLHTSQEQDVFGGSAQKGKKKSTGTKLTVIYRIGLERSVVGAEASSSRHALQNRTPEMENNGEVFNYQAKKKAFKTLQLKVRFLHLLRFACTPLAAICMHTPLSYLSIYHSRNARTCTCTFNVGGGCDLAPSRGHG